MINSKSDEAVNQIQWIGQYPLQPGESSDRRLKDRVVEFITGRDDDLSLIKPVSIYATDPDTFWILDQGKGVILNVQDNVGEIPHFKNSEFQNFPSLVGMISLPGDSLIFSDSFMNSLFVYVPSKKRLFNLNDSLKLEQPTGIAFSEVNQEIWVVETKAHRISVLSKTGQLIRQLGKRGVAPGEFNYPTSIWIDKVGNVFIVDALNFRIQIFSKDGELIKAFGQIGDATGYFARPKGIATDSKGNIYVSDALFNAVQIFDISGNFLYTFGVQGRGKGEFWMPAGIFVDNDDNIYVADSYNSRVQVFHLK